MLPGPVDAAAQGGGGQLVAHVDGGHHDGHDDVLERQVDPPHPHSVPYIRALLPQRGEVAEDDREGHGHGPGNPELRGNREKLAHLGGGDDEKPHGEDGENLADEDRHEHDEPAEKPSKNWHHGKLNGHEDGEGCCKARSRYNAAAQHGKRDCEAHEVHLDRKRCGQVQHRVHRDESHHFRPEVYSYKGRRETAHLKPRRLSRNAS